MITGGQGFTGRHIAQRLTAGGRRVISYNRHLATDEDGVHLSRDGTLRVDRDSLASAAAVDDIETQLRTQERETIDAALRATAGRIAGPDGAAKRLGLAPSTLEFRIKRLGIDKFKYRGRRQA